jgi:small-conductance mechanosensitive channel
MFERPIQPGDLIEVGGVQGRVRMIGLRATRIQTGDGADAIVPNGTLLSSNLTNWTLSDRKRRIDMTVGVAYGADVRRVLDILLTTAARQPRALPRPEPAATFTGFGDSTLNFSLQFWTGDFDGWGQVRSQAYVDLCEALQAAGIDVPYPQRDLHLRSISGEAQALLRPPP